MTSAAALRIFLALLCALKGVSLLVHRDAPSKLDVLDGFLESMIQLRYAIEHHTELEQLEAELRDTPGLQMYKRGTAAEGQRASQDLAAGTEAQAFEVLQQPGVKESIEALKVEAKGIRSLFNSLWDKFEGHHADGLNLSSVGREFRAEAGPAWGSLRSQVLSLYKARTHPEEKNLPPARTARKETAIAEHTRYPTQFPTHSPTPSPAPTAAPNATNATTGTPAATPTAATAAPGVWQQIVQSNLGQAAEQFVQDAALPWENEFPLNRFPTWMYGVQAMLFPAREWITSSFYTGDYESLNGENLRTIQIVGAAAALMGVEAASIYGLTTVTRVLTCKSPLNWKYHVKWCPGYMQPGAPLVMPPYGQPMPPYGIPYGATVDFGPPSPAPKAIKWDMNQIQDYATMYGEPDEKVKKVQEQFKKIEEAYKTTTWMPLPWHHYEKVEDAIRKSVHNEPAHKFGDPVTPKVHQPKPVVPGVIEHGWHNYHGHR